MSILPFTGLQLTFPKPPIVTYALSARLVSRQVRIKS